MTFEHFNKEVWALKKEMIREVKMQSPFEIGIKLPHNGEFLISTTREGAGLFSTGKIPLKYLTVEDLSYIILLMENFYKFFEED